MARKNSHWTIAGVAAVALSACTGTIERAGENPTAEEQRDAASGRLLGDALTFSPGRSADNQDGSGSGGAGIGVNSYLWRASLDTLSFMPLSSAEPFGGVIISDWYSPPESPDQRFKVMVYILGTELRSDLIRASVFRQNRDGSGWADAAVEDDTAPRQLEDAILTRARELRISGTS